MAEYIFNEMINLVTDSKGEIADNWIDVGGNNVVFQVGEVAVKVCFSLLNDHLKTPETHQTLLEATQQEIMKANREDERLSQYFGDSFLPTHAYLAVKSIHGRTIQKIYSDKRRDYAFRLSPDTLYRDVPLMVAQQPFFSPYAPPTCEAIGFYIGKGDYNHLDKAPDRQVYEHLNDILLGGTPASAPLQLDEIYDVQKSESIIYYMKKLREDAGFKAMMREFIPQVARYTHETGAMIDILPVRPNGLFLKHEQTGLWSAKFYEMNMPKSFGDIAFLHESRRNVLSNPLNENHSDEALMYTNMVISYMRSLNVLAIESGIQPPFNIFCENGDPNMPPDCELSKGGWWAVYERIQILVDKLYEGRPKPSHVGIYASVWKSN